MSIVSLVIAPTLAEMKTNCPGECSKPECHKTTIIKSRENSAVYTLKK
jgi:hypothetical protein